MKIGEEFVFLSENPKLFFKKKNPNFQFVKLYIFSSDFSQQRK